MFEEEAVEIFRQRIHIDEGQKLEIVQTEDFVNSYNSIGFELIPNSASVSSKSHL